MYFSTRHVSTRPQPAWQQGGKSARCLYLQENTFAAKQPAPLLCPALFLSKAQTEFIALPEIAAIRTSKRDATA